MKKDVSVLSVLLLTASIAHPNVFAEMEAYVDNMQRQIDREFHMLYNSWYGESESQYPVKYENEQLSSSDSGNLIKKVEIKTEKDDQEKEWVVLNISLPKNMNIKNQGIDIQTNDKSLVGTIDCNGKKLNIRIDGGKYFTTSVEYKKTEKSKDDNHAMYSSQSSSVSQTNVIPKVNNLNKATISVKDGLIVIRMPSADVSSKKEWTKLKINTESDSKNDKEK